MNSFDFSILHFFNSFVNRSPLFDSWVVFTVLDPLLDGGVLIAFFWWAWGRFGKSQSAQREILMFGLVDSFLSVFVARILSAALPFRERPMRIPSLHWQFPHGIDSQTSIHWSSFPSDHATLAFCLAAILWQVSKPLGSIAALQVFFAVGLARIYCGIHYPTDILAGAVLGIGIAFLAKITFLRLKVARPATLWLDKQPASFYAVLFLWTFEMAEMFDSVRNFFQTAGITEILKTMFHLRTTLLVPGIQGIHVFSARLFGGIFSPLFANALLLLTRRH
jgi:undecaprenyl-diphosphatase